MEGNPDTMNSVQRSGDEEGSVDGDEAGGGPTSKKSERKRQREKDRRKEMKEGFVELAQLLAQMEHQDESDMPNWKRKRRGSCDEDGSTDPDGAAITRIDLISKAIDTIRKLHAENIELKRSNGSVDNKEVLVMVPTLQPSSGAPQPPASGAPTTPAVPGSAPGPFPGYYPTQQSSSVDPRHGRGLPHPQQPSTSSYYQQPPHPTAQSGASDHSDSQQPPPAGPPPSYGLRLQWGAAPPPQYLHGPPLQQPYYPYHGVMYQPQAPAHLPPSTAPAAPPTPTASNTPTSGTA